MYLKDKLDNGIRVVMEKISYVNSVSIGILINNGSIKEDKHLNGVSHFIEHMLFKGTINRTAKDLAEAIDNIGGQINAFTGSEYTCYYVKVLDNHLPIAIEVLSDMLNNSKFDYDDIEKEKGVIFEEINMYLDSPEDIVYDILSEIMFENTSLSLPILGSYETVSNLNRETILKYYNDHYTAENMVISIVGNFNSKDTIEMLNDHFYKNYLSTNDSITSLDHRIPKLSQKLRYQLKDTEQLNFCLGMEGVKRGSDDIYPLLVMNNIFGGSMSSRLFQKIREDKGLVYSVYSHPTSFQNIGTFTIYAGLSAEQIINVAKLIKEDIENLKVNLISKEELKKSKEQLKGNYILGMESTFSRMLDIGKSELLLGKILSPEEILNKISKVYMDDIEKVVSTVFNKDKYNIAYVGNIPNYKKIDESLKEIFFN
jgi:predicted Zn-dependent peptidase